MKYDKIYDDLSREIKELQDANLLEGAAALQCLKVVLAKQDLREAKRPILKRLFNW